jgi:hypothetical protein
VTETGTQVRSVYVWVCEGTWRATVDAALDLAPAGARFTLLHVTPAEVPDAVRALEEMAATSAGELLKAAAGRLGRACERLEISGRAERAVVAASARADLLIVARDGDRTRLACPVLLVWSGSAPDVATTPPPPHHPSPPGH